MTTINPTRLRSPILVLALLWLVSSIELHAADLKLQACLVWGTNQDKVQDQAELEPKLRDKLRNVFRWKNYFEVSRQPINLASGGNEKVKMSDDCTIEVKHLGGNNLEVKLVGKGNSVVTKRQAITKDGSIVLAGPAKNDTAWFVVLALVGDK